QKDPPPAPVVQVNQQVNAAPDQGKPEDALVRASDQNGPPVIGEPLTAPAPLPALAATDLGQQEKYDAALLDAVNLVADGNFADALAALEAARAIQDTEQVHIEIDKVKRRVEQQAAAEQTVLDIQAVLADGTADEAAKLAAAALQNYGGTTVAVQLT